MISLSHPTGNQNVREVALALSEAGLFDKFYTTINWNSEGALHRFLPGQLQKILARRSYPRAVRLRTQSYPGRELIRLVGPASGVGSLFSVDSVARALDRKVARKVKEACRTLKGVYAYEDCALETFRAARARGVQCLYDLPIGYWRVAQRIYAEEAEREPEWASTLTGTRDSSDKLRRKEEELHLADHVVVASRFTKETLAEAGMGNKITVVAYGASAPLSREARTTSPKLRVLFAGALGQRKGLSYFLRAVEAIGSDQLEVSLIGRKVSEDCAPLNEAVRRYRWLATVSHEQMLREMRGHDVVVFPSLCEGFGLVITEAMSQGTPVITTSHTAGPDLIEDGVDGFIVPLRSSEAITAKLELLLRNRDLRSSMQRGALEKVAARPWQRYREEMVALVRDVLRLHPV